MSLVSAVQDALARVASECKALKQDNQTLAQAILELGNAVDALEAQPEIVVSATQPVNPAEGTIWLDTSGI